MRLLALSLIKIVACGGMALGQMEDPGKEEIGTIKTELIFGTNGDLSALGKDVKLLPAEEQKRLRNSAYLRKYKSFASLGSDTQPILRGYKNWAAPMAKSKAIMVTFQPQGRVGASKMRLDIELWQNEKMVLRTDPTLKQGKRVYILGPKWRGGHLIITVELVSLKAK